MALLAGRRAPVSPRVAFAALFAVTLLSMLSVGATLPILPRYVQGPIGAGDLAVGVVVGAFAITGLACRPLAGSFADSRGRRPVVLAGALLMALASALYFVPAGVPGLIVARLLLGAGEGMVYTAGASWVVDIAPVERRGRIIGLYGLAIWSGLAFGPPIGELLLRASSYELVWAFATAAGSPWGPSPPASTSEWASAPRSPASAQRSAATGSPSTSRRSRPSQRWGWPLRWAGRSATSRRRR